MAPDGHDPGAATALKADIVPMPRRRRIAWLRQLGPGLITGAADDDPSGIVTYTQAGAQLGYAACWVLMLCYPLIIVTQEISARIGRATGGGIVANLRSQYPACMVAVLVGLIVFTNTVNLGADLGAMADVLQLLLGGPRLFYVVLCGASCAGLLLRLRLQLYMRVVKWAALSLLVYVLAAFSVAPSWNAVLWTNLVPALPIDRASVIIFVALMGTTISPYLFIWQSSLEGERARAFPRLHGSETASLARAEIGRIRTDTGIGMMVASVVSCAVVITAGSTLHAAGITEIATTADAARTLRPLAGPLTHALFSLGILATGLLAVPMLAGSAAYALGESCGWATGLGRRPSQAPAFHGCIVAATAAGMGLNLFGFNSIRILLLSALINGLLSAPVLAAIMLVAVRPEIMGQLIVTGRLKVLGWISVVVMGMVALGLLTSFM